MVVMICFRFGMAAGSTGPQGRGKWNGMEWTHGVMSIFLYERRRVRRARYNMGRRTSQSREVAGGPRTNGGRMDVTVGLQEGGF